MAWIVLVAAGALLLAGAVHVARGMAAESARHRRAIADRYHFDEVTAGFFHLVELPYRVATDGDRIDAGVLAGLDVALAWRVARPDAPSEDHLTAVVVKDPSGLPESSLERVVHLLPGHSPVEEEGDLGWLGDEARAALEAHPSWFRIDTAGDQHMLVEETDETGPSHGQVDHMFAVAFGALGRIVELPAPPPTTEAAAARSH